MRLRTWSFELWGLAGSLAAFIVLIILLSVFDGKAVFEWHGITLNTVVSVSALSMKACLIFSVAECIGQWKWIIFARQERCLMDFERIDLASRGPLGSAYLAGQKKIPWTLRLGLLAMLASIGLGPFSQQLIQLQQGTSIIDSLNGAQATSPKANQYNMGMLTIANTSNSKNSQYMNDTVIALATQIDVSMEAAILNALSRTRDTNSLKQQTGSQCPSGNCTWPVFETLGVCHRCKNTSDQLRRVDGFGEFFNFANPVKADQGHQKEDGIAFTLPNGHFIANLDKCSYPMISKFGTCSEERMSKEYLNTAFSMTTFSTGNPNQTVTMNDIDTLIWSTSFTWIDESEMQRKAQGTGKEYNARATDAPSMTPWKYWPDIPLQSMECAIFYCVKSIELSVRGNLVYEESQQLKDAVRDPESWQPTASMAALLTALQDNEDGEGGFVVVTPTSNPLEWSYSSENIPHDKSLLNSLEFDKMYSVIGKTDLVLQFPDDSTKSKYRITQAAVLSINNYYSQLLKGQIVVDSASWEGIMNVSENILNITKPAGYSGFQTSYDSISGYPSYLWSIWDPDVSKAYERLAMGMTNEIRVAGNKRYTSNDSTISAVVDSPNLHQIGQIHQSTTLYRTEWYWISLHGLVFITGLSFCILTVRFSAHPGGGIPVWKTNSLATMRQGKEAARFLQDAWTVSEMERVSASKTLRVVLNSKESLSLGESDILAAPHSREGLVDNAEDGT